MVGLPSDLDLQALRAHRDELRAICAEVLDLLEKHEPPWYLRRHYERLTAALAQHEYEGKEDR